MTIGGDYSIPVNVNGFLCKNCTDVENAKKHIDPAHPRSGPYGIDAKTDPTVNKTTASSAVIFGGSLSGLNATSSALVSQTASDPSTPEFGTGNSANSQNTKQVDLVV